ncbi:MAG: hypothetical protein K8F59_11035 [Rhodobacteraceae bacterium]|nr:hypothetical protein [Paracoccaceae bacterium]
MIKRDLEKAGNTTAVKTKRTPPALKLQERADGGVDAACSGDFESLVKAIGNERVAQELLKQLSALGSQGRRIDEHVSNFGLGFVDAMQPKDAVEALLLAQMAVIHQATMMMARQLNHVDSIPQQDSAERALNKLGRTFAAQVDTLKRYRSKGQQTVRIERVTVQEGGQAVVGNVSHGGGDNET